MMFKACLLFLSCLVGLSACKFNPNFQGRGAELVQGTWEEEPVNYQDSLIQYTRHKFKFTCDSVYITLETISKANYYPDSCFNNGVWKEYAKGNYILKNDTLYLSATFTKPNFKQKLSGCYRIGQYIPSFVIKSSVNNQLELKGLQQHIPLKLKLVERTKCVPQPL
ncbi:MAG TPA: fumarate hydratase [Pedobacter sp.]